MLVVMVVILVLVVRRGGGGGGSPCICMKNLQVLKSEYLASMCAVCVQCVCSVCAVCVQCVCDACMYYRNERHIDYVVSRNTLIMS